MMLIDISAVTKLIEYEKELEFYIEKDALCKWMPVPDELFQYNSPLYFKGTVQNNDGNIQLTGQFTFKYLTYCDKCRVELEREMTINLDEALLNEEVQNQENQEDFYSYKAGSLDMTKIISDYIFLNLPMRSLCSDDCKGICFHCGTDLNDGKCQCQTDNIDSRLEALKGFFENQQE